MGSAPQDVRVSQDPRDRPGIFVATAPPAGWLGNRARIGLRITWTGCAGFVFESGGTRICFDPFVTNPGPLRVLLGPAQPDTELVRETFGAVDAVFVGHTHYDHAMDLAAVAGNGSGTVIHGSQTTVELCRRQGVAAGGLRAVRDGERVTAGPFAVTAIASAHGVVPIAGRIERADLPATGVPRSPLRWPCGEVFAYRIEIAGTSFHVQTSAGIADGPLRRQSPADVLIACLAARHGTPGYLARLGRVLRPKVLIPCHHDNFLYPARSRPRPVPQLRWNAFLDDLDTLHAGYGTRLVRLPRGIPVEA